MNRNIKNKVEAGVYSGIRNYQPPEQENSRGKRVKPEEIHTNGLMIFPHTNGVVHSENWILGGTERTNKPLNGKVVGRCFDFAPYIYNKMRDSPQINNMDEEKKAKVKDID
jgi:hypothetical protein